MTAERLTAREKFVEAIRHFFTDEDVDKCCIDRARQAIEAFADVECRLAARGDTPESGALCYRREVNAVEPHTVCRAALIKEVFGE